MNLTYDQALSFGKLAPIASGQFPDTLNLGKVDGESGHYPGKESTNADRLTVDICCDAPDGGTSITATVQGSADGSTGWTDVGKNTFTLEQLKAGPCQTAVSPNTFKHLRVSVAATGAFTGSAQAFLNTYAGK
jgi:hypothetical protein